MKNERYTPIRRSYTYEHKIGSVLNWLFWIIVLVGGYIVLHGVM